MDSQDLESLIAKEREQAKKEALQEASVKSAHKRIDSAEDKIKTQQKNTEEMLKSIATSTNELVAMRKNVDDIGEKVDVLENKTDEIEKAPAKRYNNIADKVVMIIVSAVVGYFLSQLGM